jgi:hypothetical protein
MGGGAWPFLVGGVICLVNSDNERDRILLNSGPNRLPSEGGWLRCAGKLAASDFLLDL